MPHVDADPWISVNTDGCGVDDLSYCGAVGLTVAADTIWDHLVQASLTHGWAGLELLAGISGTVGEAVLANHTAYGHSVGDVVARVRTWDAGEGRQRTFAAAECGFAPGGSRLSAEPGRYAVLDVLVQLRQGDLSAPIQDAEFARLAGVRPGVRLPLARARAVAVAGQAGRDV